METNKVLTSYDDIEPINMVEYCYETVAKWLTSCKNLSQMNAAENAVKLFRKMFPTERNKSQHLYRKFLQIKRGFILNN